MKGVISFLHLALLSLLLLSLPVKTEAQRLAAGPQDLSFFSSVDDTDQPYSLYIPENFDESRAYPLVVFLHGAWSNHRLGLRRLFGVGNSQGYDFIRPGTPPFETDVEASRYWPELRPVDYFAAAPYARGTAGYQGVAEQDVYDMIDDLTARFHIDRDRIYLTGLSMGGGGTIWLGLTRPDLWAAIAPVCPAPPEKTEYLADNAGNLPVHLFIGDQDFLYATASEWKTKFETTALMFNYVEYPGVGHNSWEWAYKDGFIFDWFSQFKRDLFPEKITYTTRWFKYNKAYWITIDDLMPGELNKIDSKYNGINTITVTTEGVKAFTLTLEDHPLFNPQKKITINVNGTSFTLRAAPVISFMRDGNRWINRRFTPGLTSKQKGAEGPMYEAVTGSHLYVYGTADNPSADLLAARRSEAMAAADWSGLAGRIMVFPRVVADREVRPSDYVRSNLILFGTRQTNSIIEKFADSLPMHLERGTEEWGVVYIYPMNRHYLLINSGLPWWTPSESRVSAGGYAFSGTRVEALRNLGDYLIFRGTPDNSVATGNFDNNWSLPAEAAEIIRGTGVITVR